MVNMNKHDMKNLTRKHIMRTMLAVLLFLAGSMTNYVTAAKVTYHILTKPFNVKTWDNQGDFRSNIRVEALQCISEEAKVGLPDQFKSPLATNFRYWGSATYTYANLYDNHTGTKIINAKYYIYQCEAGNQYACLSNEILNPEGTSSDAYTDIYVTYDYINDSHELGWKNGIMELDGATKYNLAITSGGTKKFMAFNRSRNNRVANANAAALSGEQLASEDFVLPQEGTGTNQLGFYYSSWGPKGLFMGFKLEGKDPYNITIKTSYEGEEIHITDKTSADSKATIKPYAGSSLFSQLGASSMWFDASDNRHYILEAGNASASEYTSAKYAEYKQKWKDAASDAERYQVWTGFYRGETPTMNSYAILPNIANGGYMFVASKANQNTGGTAPTIKQPNASGQYYVYYDYFDTDGGKRRSQPYFKLQSLNSAYPTNFYEIRNYTVNIKTHGSGSTLTATMKWSDAMLSEDPADHVPDALKRKYVTYSAYKDEALTQPMTTFDEAAANSYVIWLDYTVSESLPFDTLAATSGTYDYRNARWYTMRMNGTAEQKNIAYNSSNNLITGSTSIGSNSDLHTGEDQGVKVQVAFIGDPYELKIISREASENANANRYIGCATGATDGTTLNTNKTGSSDISTWEIVYENTDFERFVLRQYNTYASPKYIGWSSAGDHPVTYSTTESRIRVVELKQVPYTYHIVRNDAGDIAVKATVNQDMGKMLRTWQDIPDIIRSPFLSTATVTYYATPENAMAKTSAIKNAAYSSTGGDIYVRYDVTISGSAYNVRLNNDYIYTDEGDAIKSKASISDSERDQNPFQWTLDYSDPYHMTIKNKDKNKYVNVEFTDKASISWSDTPSYFVAKSGALTGTYEVMAATGESVNASTTYYNIGRPEQDVVKLYSNASYLHGNQTIRFQLIGTEATVVQYHLIDKAGKVLLKAATRQTQTDPVDFPPEFRSPLVSDYHYFY